MHSMYLGSVWSGTSRRILSHHSSSNSLTYIRANRSQRWANTTAAIKDINKRIRLHSKMHLQILSSFSTTPCKCVSIGKIWFCKLSCILGNVLPIVNGRSWHFSHMKKATYISLASHLQVDRIFQRESLKKYEHIQFVGGKRYLHRHTID